MVLIGSVLAFLEFQYNVEEISGFWVIFTPFIPATIWALYMNTLGSSIE